jgi:hypothetical protein
MGQRSVSQLCRHIEARVRSISALTLRLVHHKPAEDPHKSAAFAGRKVRDILVNLVLSSGEVKGRRRDSLQRPNACIIVDPGLHNSKSSSQASLGSISSDASGSAVTRRHTASSIAPSGTRQPS